MALIEQSELEARLKRTLSAEESSAFTLINSGLQSYVESLIGSKVESVSATSRYYNGGVQHLRIDPCTDLTSLDLVDDDQVVVSNYDTTDYVAESINQTLKTMIIFRAGKFVTGIRNLKVTAKFSIYGDENYRNIIKDAMLDALVGEIGNASNILKQSIEGYSVEFAQAESKASLDRIKVLLPEV